MKCESLLPDVEVGRHAAELDLVVPFTTPDLTRAAIRAAEQLGGGLAASLRLIRLQVVPYHTEACPVNVAFLQKQMEEFDSDLPLHAMILLTRETEAELLKVLRPESIVLVATEKRHWLKFFWPTPTERLARKLRLAGHRVVLVPNHIQRPSHIQRKVALNA